MAATIRAATVETLGSLDHVKVREVPASALRATQVRVEVEAASLTFMDLLFARGHYQERPDLPFTLGLEAAGIVVEVGADVDRISVGDRVSVGDTLGCLASEVVADERNCVSIGTLAAEQACAGRIAYGTALYALRERARLKTGERLIVSGASGGVGTAALEIGRHLGARVVGLVDRVSRIDRAIVKGADHALVITEETVATMRSQGLARADVVLDVVGGAQFQTLLRLLGWRARILPVGFASGTIPDIPANRLLLKEAQALGVNYGAWVHREPQANLALQGDVVQWLADGHLNPDISVTFPLSETSQGLKLLAGSDIDGKIVIRP